MGEAVTWPSASAALAPPAPRHGEVFVDPRGGGRVLRASWHADSQTVVLSIWRGEQCVASHRLPASDVGRLVAALIDGMVDGAG